MTKYAYAPEAWAVDDDGRVQPRRQAEFWTARSGRRLSCELCWRRCELADGDAGWCKIRSNRRGALEIPAHGVITNAQPVILHYFWFRQHARFAWFSGSSCTSHCSFCTSTDIAWAPEKLTWASNGERRVGTSGGWAYHRAMLHPEGAISAARKWNCSGVYLGANEPTLTWEWSYDVARLAKQAGFTVNMDTNGFSTPASNRKIAPFLDMVHVGLKGHADPEFYARRMRAEGAVPHVLRSAKAWRNSGVLLGVSDIVPPPHWMAEERAAEAARRLYSWIAEELGPLTPLQIRGMVKPERGYGEWFQPLLPRGYDDVFNVAAFMDRCHVAEEIARECGLRYVYSDEYRTVDCHHCGGVLIGKIGWLNFDLHVTDGRCDHCRGRVPIIAITRAEWDEIQREAAAGEADNAVHTGGGPKGERLDALSAGGRGL